MTHSLLEELSVSTDVSNAHPDWLRRLREEHIWAHNGVPTSFHISNTFCTPVSKIYILEDDEGNGISLFLKVSRPDIEVGRVLDGEREVAFYQHIAPTSTSSALPCCYASHFDEQHQAYYLLLHNLGHTHYQHEFALPPNRMNTERMVRTLAACHATWWNHDRLGKDLPDVLANSGNWQFSTTESCLDILNDTHEIYPAFEAFMSDRLPAHRRNTYHTFFQHKERLAELISTAPHRTVIHGDAHAWNFLLPKEDHNEPVKLIDWQHWDLSAGPRDLAYMMTLFWFQDQRQTMQDFVFDIYLDELKNHHITDYSREQAWTDYRIWAALNIIYPVWSYHYKMWPDLWYPQLERTLSAFEDLACVDLFS